jgi:hypothetical protein
MADDKKKETKPKSQPKEKPKMQPTIIREDKKNVEKR